MIPAYVLAMVLVAGALWIFRHTAEDVYLVLAVMIAAICFVVGFAHASWVAQVLVALVLVAIDRSYRGRRLGMRRS
jgi:hypothetical protein